MSKLVCLSLSLLLVACGGGGGDDASPTPPPQVTPTPMTFLSGTKLQSSFDKQSSQLTLEWTDVTTNELGYRVEQKIDSAATVVGAVSSEWRVVEDLPPLTGSGQQITWKQAINTQGEYRVLAKLPEQNKILLTASSQQSLLISTDIQASIELSVIEPLRSSVSLSVQTTGFTPKSVIYYGDLFFLGKSTSTPNFNFSWNLASQTDGTHQLLAKIETSPDSYFLVQRSVQIDNPNIAMGSLTTNLANNELNIKAVATSDFGIKQVKLFIDNQFSSTLSLANACTYNGQCSVLTAYSWAIAASTLSFGEHQIKVIAEDNQGEIAEKTTAYFKNDIPQITLDSLTDGQIVGNNVLVSGLVIDDEDNPLVVIKLRDLEVYRTVGKSFSINLDLSTFSLAAGSYTLTFMVTPKTGVSIAKSIQVNYQPNSLSIQPELLGVLGADITMEHGVSQNNLLLSNANSFYLYDIVTHNQRLIMSKNDIDYLQVGQIIGNRVLFWGQDKISKQYQIYLWDNGTLKNISELSGANDLGEGYQVHPIMRGSWIAWSAGSSTRYHLYNVDTQESHVVTKPSYSSYMGNWQYDLAILSDTVRFYTWVQTGGSGTSSRFDMLQYDTKTKTTTRLTNNGLQNIYPQVGAARVVWSQTPTSQSNNPPYSLVVASINSPSNQQVLSSIMNRFWLVDDLLVWEESQNAQTSIQANTGISQYSLPVVNSQIIAVGDDKVVYTKNNTTWVWQPSKTPYQLFSFVVNQPQFDAVTGMFYFTTGTENNAYRIKLP